MATYLITSQEIKENTALGGNVDSDNLMHLIYDCQVLVLENVLGTKLYDKIVTDFVADTLAGVYLAMFTTYIKPVLWHSVYADYLRESRALARNSGVYTNIPQEAKPTDLEELKYSAKGAQSKADVYIDRLTRYLCDQSSSIPEYTTSQDNDYDVKPSNDISTISGWYFGNNNNNYKKNNLDCFLLDE